MVFWSRIRPGLVGWSRRGAGCRSVAAELWLSPPLSWRPAGDLCSREPSRNGAALTETGSYETGEGTFRN